VPITPLLTAVLYGRHNGTTRPGDPQLGQVPGQQRWQSIAPGESTFAYVSATITLVGANYRAEPLVAAFHLSLVLLVSDSNFRNSTAKTASPDIAKAKKPTTRTIGMEMLPMANTYTEVIRQFHQNLRDAIVSRPDFSYAQIARQFGVSEVTVYTIAVEFGIGRIKTGPKPGWLKKSKEAVNG